MSVEVELGRVLLQTRLRHHVLLLRRRVIVADIFMIVLGLMVRALPAKMGSVYFASTGQSFRRLSGQVCRTNASKKRCYQFKHGLHVMLCGSVVYFVPAGQTFRFS